MSWIKGIPNKCKVQFQVGKTSVVPNNVDYMASCLEMLCQHCNFIINAAEPWLLYNITITP